MAFFLAISAAAFVLAAIDYWVDLRFYRSAVAFVATAGFLWVLDDPGVPTLIVSGLAGGFLVVATITLMESLNTALNKLTVQRGSRR